MDADVRKKIPLSFFLAVGEILGRPAANRDVLSKLILACCWAASGWGFFLLGIPGCSLPLLFFFPCILFYFFLSCF